jgi:hypothetical protein
VVDLSLSSLFAIALNLFSPSVGSDEEVIEAVRLVKRASTNLRRNWRPTIKSARTLRAKVRSF